MRALLALILLLLSSGSGLASSFEDELARAHFLSGQSYFDEGRLEEALHEFREAYRISRRPGFQYNIAVCQEKLGHTDGAIEAFERYLREAPAAPDRATIEERLTELRARPSVAPLPAPRRSPAERPVRRPRLGLGRTRRRRGGGGHRRDGGRAGRPPRRSSGRTLPDVRPQ